MTDTWEGGPARVRTSDAEREQLATVLRAAVTEGRLSLSEGDDRLARAYHATYRDELTPLVADLPGGGWDALARTPEARAVATRGLRRHAFFTAFAVGLLFTGWVLSGAHFFWPFLPVLFLVFGLMRHARSVRYPGAAGWPGWARARHGGPWGGGHWGGGHWGGQEQGGSRGPWTATAMSGDAAKQG